MTDTTTPAIPAGWYSDPAGSGQLRWWSGVDWTAYLAPRPEPVVLAPPPVVQGEPIIQIGPEAPPSTPTRWNTVSSWLLALSPVIYLAVYLGTLPQLAGLAGPFLVVAVVIGSTFIPFVIAVIFASVDRHRLHRFGYQRPASVWWMLLSPVVYLIVRTLKLRRVVGRGSGPLWVWIGTWALCCVIAGATTVALLPTISQSLAVGNLALGIQNSYNADGGDYVVTCPPTASPTIGSKFDCTAVDQTTHVSHTLAISVIAGINGEPTVRIDSVTPPIPR